MSTTKTSLNFPATIPPRALPQKSSPCGRTQIVWQSVGRLIRIWPVLEWTHFLCGEIHNKENWLLIHVQPIFHTPAASHSLQDPNPLLFRIRLASMERALQAFSCHHGCSSETSYQANWRSDSYRLSRFASSSKKCFRALLVLWILCVLMI